MQFGSAVVTPCVGVWIETSALMSLATVASVTPCVGVWIETMGVGRARKSMGSHPVWVCGLKRAVRDFYCNSMQSHPVWVCGLKQHRKRQHRSVKVVTPCVGVWIETSK